MNTRLDSHDKWITRTEKFQQGSDEEDDTSQHPEPRLAVAAVVFGCGRFDDHVPGHDICLLKLSFPITMANRICCRG